MDANHPLTDGATYNLLSQSISASVRGKTHPTLSCCIAPENVSAEPREQAWQYPAHDCRRNPPVVSAAY
jgi:hypothetical protein